ncbi:MAG: hypothetical protein Q4G67_08020 [Actinomycetia bacterium]|nr:hypothetical protein [Actinomycetes bacterium]
MATITVRGLDDAVVERLKARARANDRSMEGEVREILAAVAREDRPHLGRLLVDIFASPDSPSVELELPRRSPPRRVPGWEELGHESVADGAR